MCFYLSCVPVYMLTARRRQKANKTVGKNTHTHAHQIACTPFRLTRVRAQSIMKNVYLKTLQQTRTHPSRRPRRRRRWRCTLCLCGGASAELIVHGMRQLLHVNICDRIKRYASDAVRAACVRQLLARSRKRTHAGRTH